jgi:hypothetical protein
MVLESVYTAKLPTFFPGNRGVITRELCFLGVIKIDFDGGSSQGFSNQKFQRWKNRLVNGS